MVYVLPVLVGLQVEDETLAVYSKLINKLDHLWFVCINLDMVFLTILAGLQVGDEILVMNSKVINELDMVYVENVLHEELQLTLTIRSCRVERPLNTSQLQQHADVYIENLMCPPPPSQTRLSDKILDELIIPKPNWGMYIKCSSSLLYNLKLTRKGLKCILGKNAIEGLE